MGISATEVLMTHMRKQLLFSGLRIRDEVNAAKRGGKDLILAKRDETIIGGEIAGINEALAKKNAKQFYALLKKEQREFKDEVAFISQAITNYTALSDDLIEDFRVLIQVLHLMGQDAANEERGPPQEREVARIIAEHSRILGAKLQKQLRHITNAAAGLTNSV